MNKKKLNKADYMYKNLQGETLRKQPGQVNGIDFLIQKCSECTLEVLDYSAQIFVEGCSDCTIHLGPVEASVFIRNSTRCTISAAASQIRISDCSDIRANIYSDTEPALENCRNIQVGPYDIGYPNIHEHFQRAGLTLEGENKWSQVFDFNKNDSSPNWTLLPPEQFKDQVIRVEGMESGYNPVARHSSYGGDLQGVLMVGSAEQNGQVEGGMTAFDIMTGQAQAQQIMQQQEEQQDFQQPDPVYEAYDAFDAFDQSAQPQWENQVNTQDQAINLFDSTPTQDQYTQQTNKRLQYEMEIQRRVREKQEEEERQKEERRARAKQDLAEWQAGRQDRLNRTIHTNRQKQDSATQQQLQQQRGWQQIKQNIETKDSLYPGTKDVGRMKESILNRCAMD